MRAGLLAAGPRPGEQTPDASCLDSSGRSSACTERAMRTVTPQAFLLHILQRATRATKRQGIAGHWDWWCPSLTIDREELCGPELVCEAAKPQFMPPLPGSLTPLEEVGPQRRT